MGKLGYRVASFVLAFGLVAAPTTVAEEPSLAGLAPPSDFSASYNASTDVLELTWSPPSNDTTTEYVYRIYQNESLVGETTATAFEYVASTGWTSFTVTASDEEGEESLPTSPILFYQSSNGALGVLLGPGDILDTDGPIEEVVPTRCQVLFMVTYSDWPFLGLSYHPYCLPVVGSMLTPIDPNPTQVDAPIQ